MKKLVAILFLGVCFTGFAQEDRVQRIAQMLDSLSESAPGLDAEVELSVSNSSIQELIRGISKVNNLNVSVSKELNFTVVNNFSNARVKDIFLFLCKEYDLTIDITGSIIAFEKYHPPPVKPKPKPKKEPKVYFNDSTQFITLDLKEDTLSVVAEEITRQTFANVIISPEVKDQLVSVYIQNRPLKKALDKFAYANGLAVEDSEDNFFLVKKADGQEQDQRTRARRDQRNQQSPQQQLSDEITVEVNEDNTLNVTAYNQPIKEVINLVCSQMGISYYLFTEPSENTTVFVDHADFESFLNYLLNGTQYTFKKESKVYLIGKQNLERLRTTEMVELKNRTVEQVQEVIPSEIKSGLEIKEFTELNSLVVTGSFAKIKELKGFIAQVDKVVPVVLIEIMIADISRTHTFATGIQAGLGEAPESENTLYPDLDITLDAGTVNDVLSKTNGFGIVNLGRVTPDFYLKLRAMEENGVLKTRSTPMLSTMNGHEANLSIGTTEYYLEVSNNVIGSQNPSFVTTQNYKSVNADLSVNIKPIVSGNQQVTLEIDVQQSDFTGRSSPNAPPGSVSRSFKSMTRVKDGEMILLGGLEEKNVNDAGSGVPFLSRIPVIKWLFSSRTKQRGKSKLTIFIKPTIIY